MAILPATKHLGGFRIGKKVEQLRSHLDLVPTLLEAYGIANFSSFGKSFLKDTTEDAPAYDRCLVSVQPFGGGYVAVVDYPVKYIFQLSDETLTTYDLQKDPRESTPSNRRPIDKAGLGVLEACLASLDH
jgi:arylsulfatase A-like enzyme